MQYVNINQLLEFSSVKQSASLAGTSVETFTHVWFCVIKFGYLENDGVLSWADFPYVDPPLY